MISNGGTHLGIGETDKPTLNIHFDEPNEYGIRRVHAAWSGLDFYSIVLIGPEACSTAMDQDRVEALVKSLGDSVAVRYKNNPLVLSRAGKVDAAQ